MNPMKTGWICALLLLSARSFSSAAEVHLQWTWQLPVRQAAWDEVRRIGGDRSYPVFAQADLVFVSCEHNGALLALDARTGTERWRFHTEGPLRTAAVGDGQRVFVGSEDGHLYCLDTSGRLLWKHRGGPSARKVLGHGRLISAWNSPASPLVHRGVVYYLAGYWPLEGVYLHALDCATGKRRWTNGVLQVRAHRLRLVEDDRLVIEGHFGSAMVDLASGVTRREKIPKRPRLAPPEVEGLVGTLAAQANGRYFTASPDGAVAGFGAETVEPRRYVLPRTAMASNATARAAALIADSGVDAGYAIVAGLEDGTLVEGLLAASDALRVVAFDADEGAVSRIRIRLDEKGALDQRLALFAAGPAAVKLPPYIGSLVTTEKGALAENASSWTRPWGGVRAVRDGGGWKLERREGPPAGASDWPQEFGDAANTLASKDRLVKAPLGVLWYGGPAGGSRYYYDGEVDHQSGHGINPQPVPAQIVAGRLILQAPGLVAAFDQYTGRLLWEAPLPSVYTFGGKGGGLGKHSKKHPFPWKQPEAEKFDVKPTQRSRASGFNFASLPDGIYICAAEQLLRLDPASGKRLTSWAVPLEEKGLCWGGLRVEADVLVATAFRPRDLADAQAGHDGNGGDWAGDRMPMAHLLALDRHTGRLLWHRPADWGYVNRSGFCIGGGRVFCVDLVTPTTLAMWGESGRDLPDAPPRLLALELESGREDWSFELDVLARNIAYSVERDLLLVPCRYLTRWTGGQWVRLDRDVRTGRILKTPPGRMRGVRGRDGEVVWEVDTRPYHHPHIILNDLIIDRRGFTFDLLTGERALRPSPLTGVLEPWSFRKAGCNHLVACENLVTWRTAFYDLANGAGVMKLTGLDAGCSPTLLPAGGILNIANFGTHHKRNRMTAMALVHRPENELWTQYYSLREKRAPEDHGAVIQRAGYNFGAPGDRWDGGTLWQRIDERTRAGLSIEPRRELHWLTLSTARTGSWTASSAVVGARTMTVPLRITADGKGVPRDRVGRRYTVRLHFAELGGKHVGERIFDVKLEGRTVLSRFDIVRSAGGPNRPVVREFDDVEIEGELDIELVARVDRPLLSGVELLLRAAPEVRARPAGEAVEPRSVLELRGHERWVASLAFSPDGTRLASGSDDGTLKLWDSSSGELVLQLSEQGPAVTAVAFSPDGERLVVGSWDGDVTIRSVRTGAVKTTLDGHSENITSLAVSPDGTRIASGSGDDTLRVWEAQSGDELLTLDPGNEYDVTAVDFGPRGELIASGDGEGAVTVWDAESGEELMTLLGHDGAISSVAFSADGQRLVSGSWDDTLRIWDLREGEERFTLRGHELDVTSVAYSRDGARIVSGSEDQLIKVWDARSGRELYTLRGHTESVTTVAIGPAGRRVASGSRGEVRIWELRGDR